MVSPNHLPSTIEIQGRRDLLQGISTGCLQGFKLILKRESALGIARQSLPGTSTVAVFDPSHYALAVPFNRR